MDDYNRMFRIIYPETRRVTGREIVSWARDLLIDQACAQLPAGTPDEEYERIAASVPVPSLLDALAILDDEGKVTFHRDDVPLIPSRE